MSKAPCLINQSACGRVAGNPVCPKCGMDERVVYPGQADREAAQAAALARYKAAQEPVKPPPPPEQTPQAPKQPKPELQLTPAPDRQGINRLGIGVLVLALLGGGWWWKDQQDQRLQLAEEQVAQQALAVEQARSERATENIRSAQAEQAASMVQERQTALAALALPAAASSATALLHGRYQILADGSEVKDVQSGLVWARCSVGQRWNEKTCAGKAKQFSFKEAQKLAGNGWRVPTVRELFGLVKCSRGIGLNGSNVGDKGEVLKSHCLGEGYSVPTLDVEVFPATLQEWYWSASTVADDRLLAWAVNFANGNVDHVQRPLSGGLPVRLVRVDQ